MSSSDKKARRILVSEAVKILGVTKARIHVLIGEGRIRSFEKEPTAGSGRLWISRRDVEKFLVERTARLERQAAKVNGHTESGQ